MALQQPPEGPPTHPIPASPRRFRTGRELWDGAKEVAYTRLYETWVVVTSIVQMVVVLGAFDWGLEHVLNLDASHSLFLRVPLLLYTLFHYVVTMGRSPIEWLATRMKRAPGEEPPDEGR